MVRQNHTNRWLPRQNGMTKSLQTRWRHKGMGAPPPYWHRQPTPEPMPALPGMPPAPPGDTDWAQSSQIDNLPQGYVYLHSPHPSTQFLNLDAYAQDSQPNTDYNLDILTDQWTSTGSYTICQVVMQLKLILQMRAANCANLVVRTNIDRMDWDFWVYYYLQS